MKTPEQFEKWVFNAIGRFLTISLGSFFFYAVYTDVSILKTIGILIVFLIACFLDTRKK